jgi:hypothetical protein
MNKSIPNRASGDKRRHAPIVPLLAVQATPNGEKEREDFFLSFNRELMAVEVAKYLEDVLGLDVASCEQIPFLPGGERGPSTFYVRCFCLRAHMTEAYNFALNVCIEFDRALIDKGLLPASKHGPDFAPAKDYL